MTLQIFISRDISQMANLDRLWIEAPQVLWSLCIFTPQHLLTKHFADNDTSVSLTIKVAACVPTTTTLMVKTQHLADKLFLFCLPLSFSLSTFLFPSKTTTYLHASVPSSFLH